MIYSHLIGTNTRTAMAARDILSIKRQGAVVALILMLALGVGVLAGSPSVHAQEQKPAAVPAAAPAAKTVSTPAVTPAVAPAVTRVNINTADAQTLAARLKGVGESRAMEIVRYREAYGPFASAEELTEVKGIGKSTLDMNRDVITLE
jgi:competence ComEA-like helix-hairpin-helix protein